MTQSQGVDEAKFSLIVQIFTDVLFFSIYRAVHFVTSGGFV